MSSRSLICSSCLLILLGGRYFSVVFLKFLLVCLIFLVAAIFRSFSQSSWLPLFSVVFIIFLVALTFPKICLLVCPCFLLGLSWLPGWSYGFSFRLCEVQDRHFLAVLVFALCLFLFVWLPGSVVFGSRLSCLVSRLCCLSGVRLVLVVFPIDFYPRCAYPSVRGAGSPLSLPCVCFYLSGCLVWWFSVLVCLVWCLASVVCLVSAWYWLCFLLISTRGALIDAEIRTFYLFFFFLQRPQAVTADGDQFVRLSMRFCVLGGRCLVLETFCYPASCCWPRCFFGCLGVAVPAFALGNHTETGGFGASVVPWPTEGRGRPSVGSCFSVGSCLPVDSRSAALAVFLSWFFCFFLFCL